MSQTYSYYERHIISHGIQRGEHAVEELSKGGKADEEKRKQLGTEGGQLQKSVKRIRDNLIPHSFNGAARMKEESVGSWPIYHSYTEIVGQDSGP